MYVRKTKMNNRRKNLPSGRSVPVEGNISGCRQRDDDYYEKL